MKKQLGFTLAEVLITLGIIGVVAAMTMPAVVAAYNNHITEVRLKKFYSVFNQAIQRSIADNGDTSTWDYWFEGQYDDDTGETQEDYSSILNGNFERYLAPYMNIIDKKDLRMTAFSQKGADFRLYYLADGSAFGYPLIHNREIYFYPKNAEKCLEKSSDELKLQNAICTFIFEFNPNNESSDWKYLYKKGLEPYLYMWSGDEKELYTGASYSCDSLKNDGSYCAAIIQRNNWKIPKDFPVKIKY